MNDLHVQVMLPLKPALPLNNAPKNQSFLKKVFNCAKCALSLVANFFYKLACLIFTTPSNVFETLFGKNTPKIETDESEQNAKSSINLNIEKKKNENVSVSSTDIQKKTESIQSVGTITSPLSKGEKNSQNVKTFLEKNANNSLNNVELEETIPNDASTNNGQDNRLNEPQDMIKILAYTRLSHFFSDQNTEQPEENGTKVLTKVASQIKDTAEPIISKKSSKHNCINNNTIILQTQPKMQVADGNIIVTKHKPLIELDLKGRCAYTKSVQKLLNSEQIHIDELSKLNADFLNEVKASEEKALILHTEFIKKYTAEAKDLLESSPTFEPLTQCAQSSLFQLKRAIEIAKKEFPCHTSLAFNNEQKNAVARLIQIILCGEIVQDYPQPVTSCCFQLRELAGKCTTYNNTRNPGIENSYLFSLIGYHEEEEDIEKNFQNAFKSFLTELTENQINLYKFSLSNSLIDLKDTNLLKTIIDLYKNFLVQQPKKALKILKFYHESDLHSMYLSVQEMLKKEIQNEKLEILQNSPFYSTLNYLHDAVNDNYNEIATLLKTTPEKVQFLFNCKLIEIILSMNSLNYAQTINELQESLENYNDNSIFSTKIKKIEFFPSKHLFSTESYLKNVISVGSDHFFAEGIQEYFVKDEIIVAEVTSKEKTTLLCSKFQENNKVSIPMTSLTLSWQATNEMMDYLTGLIDPKAADSQPENLFIILKEEMKESIKKLNGVAALSEGWTSWTLKSISGYLGYTSTIKEEEELNDIKQLASILNSAFDTCRQYIRMASLSNKTSDQFIDDIVTFKNSLQNTYATLSSLQMQFAKEKLLKKSELINEILNYINSELALLPSDEISYDGYVKRISQALIWQSNEAKQISWKIRRYEEQISELTRLFELHLEDLLKKQTDWTASNCGLYESIIIEESAFSKTAEVIGGGIVNYLYNGLKEINDSTETTPTNVDNYYTQQRLDRVRGGYTKFLTIFRKSFDREMTKENPNPINMGTLQRIAVLLYTEINLYSELSDTLIQFNEMGAATLGQPLHEINSQAGKRVLSYAEQAKGLVGIQPVLSHNVKFHPEVQWIYTIYERIRAVPCGAKVRLLDGWINSAKGQWNRNFDPNMQSNPIHLLSTLEIDLGNGKIPKIIKMLGMGTVTKEDLYSVITLVPEFIAFIRGYKDSGKRHLYVNNQNMLPIGDDYISQALNGDETPRCKLIMGAQSLKDLKGALFAITLSKNSKFYRQEGPFKERYNAKSFTEELYEQVFVKTPKESGCYISPEIRDLLLGFNIDLNEKAKFIIEQIHTIFDKRISLTQEERKIFIELFYNKLTKVILIGGKFDSCNISCKDQIDRAAGSNAIAYAEDAIVNSENGNLTADDVEMIRILMLVRAIFVRKREPIQERVDRFCETYNFLLENMHAMKALHKQIFSNIRITPGPC